MVPVSLLRLSETVLQATATWSCFFAAPSRNVDYHNNSFFFALSLHLICFFVFLINCILCTLLKPFTSLFFSVGLFIIWIPRCVAPSLVAAELQKRIPIAALLIFFTANLNHCSLLVPGLLHFPPSYSHRFAGFDNCCQRTQADRNVSLCFFHIPTSSSSVSFIIHSLAHVVINGAHADGVTQLVSVAGGLLYVSSSGTCASEDQSQCRGTGCRFNWNCGPGPHRTSISIWHRARDVCGCCIISCPHYHFIGALLLA